MLTPDKSEEASKTIIRSIYEVLEKGVVRLLRRKLRWLFRTPRGRSTNEGV